MQDGVTAPLPLGPAGQVEGAEAGEEAGGAPSPSPAAPPPAAPGGGGCGGQVPHLAGGRGLDQKQRGLRVVWMYFISVFIS